MAIDPNIPVSFADVQSVYDRALLLADRNWIRLLAASILANQMDGNPVWLMIIASSSSGKTASLMTIEGLEFVPGKRIPYFISDLTENTLASGFKSSEGNTSLLKKMPYGGIFVFKDFTSMLVKRSESRDAIMGQLREVYDRRFDKLTGNNQNTEWTGKIGALAAVTEAVHEYMSSMSVMGDRFIMYAPIQPDRRALLRFIIDIKNDKQGQEERLHLAREYLQRYLKDCWKRIGEAKLVLLKEDEEHLMEVADFVTRARSGVIEDPHNGQVRFVPSAEMPTRLIDQLLSIGKAISLMRVVDGKDPSLDANDMNVLYKIAFDSIPLKRLWALHQLAKYQYGVTTAGIAAVIGYESIVVHQWLAQLNALGIIVRDKSTGKGDMWKLNEDSRKLMVTYQHVNVVEEMLEDPNATEDDLIVERAFRNDF